MTATTSNGTSIGQTIQRRHCSQGFHLGSFVNKLTSSYPRYAYTIPISRPKTANTIRSITDMIPPLLFVKQACHHTDPNGNS